MTQMRFERTTFCLGGRCSIQLSYWVLTLRSNRERSQKMEPISKFLKRLRYERTDFRLGLYNSKYVKKLSERKILAFTYDQELYPSELQDQTFAFESRATVWPKQCFFTYPSDSNAAPDG